jgi:virginiamycin B lyase
MTSWPDPMGIWFVVTKTGLCEGYIGCVSTTGMTAEFAIPTQRSCPTGITVGPDGNIWFTETSSDKIAYIVP